MKENQSVKKLEAGKDYVSVHDNDVVVIDRVGDIMNRGFQRGKYKNHLGCTCTSNWRKATESEVIEAFKKHLVKRYGKDWRTMKIKEKHPSLLGNINDDLWDVEILKDDDGWNVYNKNGLIYCNGIWVERLEDIEAIKFNKMEETSKNNETAQLGIGAVSSRSVLESDKRIVYEMGTTMANYTLMSAYEYGTIHDFGEKSGIINTRNYMTVINRLRKALESLWLDGRCERMKYYKGYTYNLTKSLGNGY